MRANDEDCYVCPHFRNDGFCVCVRLIDIQPGWFARYRAWCEKTPRWWYVWDPRTGAHGGFIISALVVIAVWLIFGWRWP